MKTSKYLLLYLFTGFIIVACKEDEILINGETSMVNIPSKIDQTVTQSIKMQDYHIGDFNAVRDSIMVSWIPNDSEAFFYVHNINNGLFLGNYFFFGRGKDETTAASPIFQIFEENNELKAYVNFHNERVIYIWNISKSIKQRTTIFEQSVPIIRKNAAFNEIFKGKGSTCVCYALPRALTINADMASLPYFIQLEYETGEIIKEFTIFKGKEYIIGDPQKLPLPEEYLRSFNCMNQAKNKIAMAMIISGQIIILDIEDGSIYCSQIQGSNSFDQFKGSMKDIKVYFTGIQCDENFIYALYSGKPYDEAWSGTNQIFVFDWNGKIIKNIIMPETIKAFCAYNGIIYTFDEKTDSLYKFKIN